MTEPILCERCHLEIALDSSPEPIRKLLVRIGKRFGVTPEEILDRTRLRNITQARHVVAWILRRRGLSLPEIGLLLHRDHTSIMNAVRKVEFQIARSPRVNELLTELLNPESANDSEDIAWG